MMRIKPLLAALLVLMLNRPVEAQSPPGARVDGEVAPPVEILMEFINGRVRCLPPRARFPARDELDFRVVNRAARPIMFRAPKFLQAAKIIRADRLVEVEEGGFLVRSGDRVRVVLRTPTSGEYYYSCHLPGQLPTPDSTGFLIVVGANE